MEPRRYSILIMMILLSLPFNLKAQEYREASHANFNLEEDRVIPMDGSEFKFRKEWAGKQVFVRIPAIPNPCSVLINGFPFSIEPDTTGSTEYNITPFLKEEDNLIDLPVAYSLLIRDAIHIRDMVITQHPGLTENESLVRVHLFLKSYLKEAYRERSILLDLQDPNGQPIIQESRTLSTALSFGQETEFIFDLDLEKPVPWLPEAPNLYTVSISLEEKGAQKPERINAQFGYPSFWHNSPTE